jgi:hypothetical protein
VSAGEVLVYEPRVGLVSAEVEEELTRAFTTMREAVEAGSPVVVCLEERAVQSLAEPADVAVAHGLIGLVRAFAIEGRKPGWTVAALAVSAETDPEDRRGWIEQLAASPVSSGSLLRLGGEHLGRVVV